MRVIKSYQIPTVVTAIGCISLCILVLWDISLRKSLNTNNSNSDKSFVSSNSDKPSLKSSKDENWVEYSESSSTGSLSIDTANISSNGNLRTYWIKVKIATDPEKEMLVKETMDCNSGTMDRLEYLHYNPATNKVLYRESHLPGEDRKELVPDSIGTNKQELVCK